MALLEDTNACAICNCPVTGSVGGVPVYYCPTCFGEYRDSILARSEWTEGMLRIEKARRKRRNRLIKSVGLPVTTSSYQGVRL